MTVRDARRLARGLDLGDPPTPPPRAEYGEPVAVGRGSDRRPRRQRSRCGRRRVRLRAGHRHRSDGPQRVGQVDAAVDPPGQPRRAGPGRVTIDGVDPADSAGRRAAASWSGWCRRPPPTCSTSRPSPTSAPAADGGSGECRKLLDRLVPGVPDDAHPRDLSEGQRLALALAVVLVVVAAGAAARRADPRAGLPGEGRAGGRAAAARRRRACGDGGDPRRGVRGPGRRPGAWCSRRARSSRTGRPGRCWRRRRRSPRRSPRSSGRAGCASTRCRDDPSARRTARSRRSGLVLGVASVAGLMMLVWPLLVRQPGGRPGRPAVRLPRPAAGGDRGGAGRGDRGRASTRGCSPCSACCRR